MMRTMLESLVSVRPSQAKGSNSIKLDSHTADLIDKFHKESLNYKHMLSFSRMKKSFVFWKISKSLQNDFEVLWCSTAHGKGIVMLRVSIIFEDFLKVC